MKPKPLYRSLTLWSGLVVIAFICWAWFRSTGYQDSIGVNRYTISHMRSMVHIEVNRFPIWENWPWKVMRDRLSPVLPSTAFPMPARKVVVGAPVTQMYIIIPHWLILLIVVPPWCGLLFWRAWLKGRAKAADAIYGAPP